MLLKRAIDSRWADAIKTCRRALHSGLLRIEDTVTRAAQARHWELAMSKQRSFKIGSFRFAAFVPKKIEYIRF
jgi:hypothetical protein